MLGGAFLLHKRAPAVPPSCLSIEPLRHLVENRPLLRHFLTKLHQIFFGVQKGFDTDVCGRTDLCIECKVVKCGKNRTKFKAKILSNCMLLQASENSTKRQVIYISNRQNDSFMSIILLHNQTVL